MISELGLDRFENVNPSTHSEILLLILIRGYNTTKRNENKKEIKNKQNKDKNKRREKCISPGYFLLMVNLTFGIFLK